MAAWGMTGVIGAGVAVLDRAADRPVAAGGRRARLAGFAFGAVQDLGDWVTYSDHSRARSALYVAKGSGFDIVARGRQRGRSRSRSARRCSGRSSASARRLRGELAPGSGRHAALSSPALAARGCVGRAGAPRRRRARRRRRATSSAPRTPTAAGARRRGSVVRRSCSRAGPRWPRRRRAQPAATATAAASLIDYIRARRRRPTDVGALERTILVVARGGAAPAAFGGRDLVAGLLAHVRRDGSVAGQRRISPSFASWRCAPRAHPVRRRTRDVARCASRTPTAASTSPPAAARASRRDRARRCEALAVAGAAARPDRCSARSRSSAPSRTATAGSRSQPGATRTRSRPRGPSRG